VNQRQCIFSQVIDDTARQSHTIINAACRWAIHPSQFQGITSSGRTNAKVGLQGQMRFPTLYHHTESSSGVTKDNRRIAFAATA
jgi:hypothetical protein